MTAIKVACQECGNVYYPHKAVLHTYEDERGYDYLSWVESECTSLSCRAQNRFFPEPDTEKKLLKEGVRLWQHRYMPSHVREGSAV